MSHYNFKKNKMICWLNNDLTVVPQDDIYKTTEQTLLENTDNYLVMIQ